MRRTDRRRAAAAVLAAVAVLAVAGCGGEDTVDDGAGPTTTTVVLDPGVSFASTTTGPPADPDAAPSPTGPGRVVTEPGRVPAGFPADFPVPDGARVEVGTSGRAEGEERFAVDYRVDGEPEDVHGFYRDAVADAGWAVLVDDDDGRGEDYVGQLVFETDTFVGSVLVAGSTGGTLLTLTVTRPG